MIKRHTIHHKPHRPENHPLVQAFITRLKSGTFGLVIWGGSFNGMIGDVSRFENAEQAALTCEAAIIHCDI